jgi:hypothetical protein
LQAGDWNSFPDSGSSRRTGNSKKYHSPPVEGFDRPFNGVVTIIAKVGTGFGNCRQQVVGNQS